MSRSSIDRAFVERVEAVLGPPVNVAVTERGRTTLRYDEFVVSREGHVMVACRRVPSGLEFAVVRADGLGEWRSARPEASKVKPERTPPPTPPAPPAPTSRLEAVRRLAADGVSQQEICKQLGIGRQRLAAMLA
jgi:hypothetical protein